MSTQSTSNQSRFVVSSTVTSKSDAPMLSQNSVLLDVGEPSTAAINEIEDMNITDYQQPTDTQFDDYYDSSNSNSSSSNNGDTNKQVIFLLFLK